MGYSLIAIIMVYAFVFMIHAIILHLIAVNYILIIKILKF